MSSFFSYARQLQTVREGIKADEQKEIFDLEVSLYQLFRQRVIHVFYLTYAGSCNMYIIILYFQTASWIPPTLPRVRNLDIVMQYLSSSLTVN